MIRSGAYYVSVALMAATLASGCLQSFSGPIGAEPGPAGGGMNGGGGGGGGGGDPVVEPDMAEPVYDLAGPPAQVGTLAVTIPSTSATLRMNESKSIVVTVTPGGGFSGVVAYTVTGLPTGVTGTFVPPGGMVSSPTTTTLTLKAASDAKTGTGTMLKVNAASGAISTSQQLTLDVNAELLVTIAKGVSIGTAAAPNLEAFGAVSMPTIFVAPGTKVTWVNQDGINHQIHSDGNLGIAHEGGPLQANAANSYTQTLNGTGTYDYRCHIHPNMKGQIVVKAPPAQ